MAGSYNHCVADDGQLLADGLELQQMLENGGDVYEAVEELYGMIWYLASLIGSPSGDENRRPAAMVELARTHYRDGLAESPGTDGHNVPEED